MITLVGAGNVATWLARRLANSKEFSIGQVFSRSLEHARRLADEIGTEAVSDVAALRPDSEMYLFAIKDDAFSMLLPQLPFVMPLALHTAGSLSRNVFSGYAQHHGVLYPLQTFTREALTTSMTVPLCLDVKGVPSSTENRIRLLAEELTPLRYEVDEQQRAWMHLAAVFACNFSNAMYDAAEQLMSQTGIPFEMLLPLMEQTLEKTKFQSPRTAQTGPAQRGDDRVIAKHTAMLHESELLEIYDVVTKFIKNRQHEI